MTDTKPPVLPSLDGERGIYSVGRLARETGISTGTLRVWERRYGNPVPLRLPSGHRRYTESQLRYLRRIAEGLARGLRPGTLLALPPEELEGVLRGGAGVDTPERLRESWLARVRSLDGVSVLRLLVDEAERSSTVGFLDDFVRPFLAEIGSAWADGQLDIRHEHFASEVVEDHLRARRRGYAVQERPPGTATVVLATLPDELHSLGLQMAALVAEEAGLRAIVLGADTPVEEMVRTVEQTGASVVATSVSLSNGGPDTDRQLALLRNSLPETVELVVGGAGARRGRRGPRGIVGLEDMRSLDRWFREYVATAPTNGNAAPTNGTRPSTSGF